MHVLEHFSVALPLAPARRQYVDRCGRSRSPSRSDGGDPAASSYGEREATQCKPLKNALGRRRGRMLLMQILVCGSIAALGFIPPRQSIWSVAALATALAFFSASL